MSGAEFRVRLAQSDADLRAVQSLRYTVFVAELGGTGPGVDHDTRTEGDTLDQFARQLMLEDLSRPVGDQLVGATRFLGPQEAAAAGRYYSDSEFELSGLHDKGLRLLELGRTCLHAGYRGGLALHVMQAKIVEVARDVAADHLIGAASFPGTDLNLIAQPLSWLAYNRKARFDVRPFARSHDRLEQLAEDQVDRKAAMLQMPTLLKAYLRLGARIGDGVFIDHDFRCTDVCVILDAPLMIAAYEASQLRRSA